MSDATYPMPPDGWVCFHCGERFTTPGAAADHFGATPDRTPGCLLQRVMPGEQGRGLLMALRRAEDERQEMYLLKTAAFAERDRVLALLNTPELRDFAAGVVREAAHQRDRWGATHDADKSAQDWYWLLAWLAGKAVHADKGGDREKLLHHIVTSAALLANWHAHVVASLEVGE